MKKRTKNKNRHNNNKQIKVETAYAKAQKAFDRRYKEECGTCTTRKATPEEMAKYFG